MADIASPVNVSGQPLHGKGTPSSVLGLNGSSPTRGLQPPTAVSNDDLSSSGEAKSGHFGLPAKPPAPVVSEANGNANGSINGGSITNGSTGVTGVSQSASAPSASQMPPSFSSGIGSGSGSSTNSGSGTGFGSNGTTRLDKTGLLDNENRNSDAATLSEPAPPTPVAAIGDKRKADEAVDGTAAKPREEQGSSTGGADGSHTGDLIVPVDSTAATAPAEANGESAAKKTKTDPETETAAETTKPPTFAAPSTTPVVASSGVLDPTPAPVQAAPPGSTPASAPAPAPTSAPAAASGSVPAAAPAPAATAVLTAAPTAQKETGADNGTATTTMAPPAVKKSSSRAKREKKPLPPVGQTARKTRSQGPADV